ncbi:MAG TPA: hypothetical protein VJQ79_08410 [Acidimicrobiia bacterium]|nr:hypothetical protein [Acidimicrobiia bacterium]
MSTRSRRATSAAGVLLLLTSLIVAVGLPAAAIDGNCNTQGGWQENVTSGEWGTITNNGNGSVSVTLNAGYSLELCVKGGSGYEVYNLTSSGGPFWPPANCGQGTQQCGLSHWAIRNVVLTTTTTGQQSTTTSEATTTTSEATTTTSQATTTTSQATTTTAQETTTTTAQVTTTQPESSTTSSSLPFDSVPEVSVLGIQVSAPEVAQVATQETLPFTGVSTSSMALLAAAFAGAGLLLLLAARQNDEKSPARSWN